MEDEAKEDLEPLFDYSRVQPANFFYFDDGDLDKSEIFEHCRKKTKKSDTAKEKVNDVVSSEKEKKVDNNKEKEEEDWLLPPPPKALSGVELQEDKTIQELRHCFHDFLKLKKQELASLARSAQDVLKDLVETAQREVKSSKQPTEEIILDPPVEERQKIVISIQDKDGHKQFCIYKIDKFEKLFKSYAKKVNIKLEDLIFSFDGEKVGPNTTPSSLGLEDDDMIEVHIKPK